MDSKQHVRARWDQWIGWEGRARGPRRQTWKFVGRPGSEDWLKIKGALTLQIKSALSTFQWSNGTWGTVHSPERDRSLSFVPHLAVDKQNRSMSLHAKQAAPKAIPFAQYSRWENGKNKEKLKKRKIVQPVYLFIWLQITLHKDSPDAPRICCDCSLHLHCRWFSDTELMAAWTLIMFS